MTIVYYFLLTHLTIIINCGSSNQKVLLQEHFHAKTTSYYKSGSSAKDCSRKHASSCYECTAPEDGKECEFLPAYTTYDYVKTDELKKLLQDGFSEKRSFHTPEGKEKAQLFIKDFFQGCFPGELQEQNFTSDDPLPNSEGVMAKGANYIYVLKGSRWGTNADKPILVGAHYDSQVDTPGVDDNGSGMVSMLQIAKFVGQSTCDRQNTAIFVAFDFEEFQYDGSAYFVEKFLKEKVLGNYGIPPSSFQGALILETIMNYDNTENSQNLPAGADQVFPTTAALVKGDGNRGNFLALIHRQEDKTLADNLIAAWKSKTSEFKILPLGIHQTKPRPADLPDDEWNQWSHMYRSDHVQFWDYGNSGDDGLKAIFITDTADFRGNMQNCYHNPCDNMEAVSEDDLKFLAKTTGVITEYVIKAISEKTDCKVDTESQTCGAGNLSPTVLIVASCLAIWLQVFQ